MAWFKGTATDYKDMLAQIKNLAKDDHISAVVILNGGVNYAIGDTITLSGGTKYHEPELEVLSIASGDYVSDVAIDTGGTGYAVDDIINVTGGTYSVQCQLKVTAVSGGAVTGLSITKPGIYSEQPTNPAATTTNGAGSGLTVNLTFTAGIGIITGLHIADSGVYTAQATNPVSQNTTSGSGTGLTVELTYTNTAWSANADYAAQEAKSVTINTPGSGYNTNDIVTVGGGVYTTPTTIKITSQSGGVPTAIQINTVGEYSTPPSNPAVTSGTNGNGLTVDITWGDAATEMHYLFLENANSGQHIGWQAYKYSSPDDAYVYRCWGFTGFNSISTPIAQQPGATGSLQIWVPLSGGTSPATIYYWISINDERIAAVFRVGSVYPNMYMGGIDPFMTQAEYGYSQLILGCLVYAYPYTYGGYEFAGMNNPGTYLENYTGPGVLRKPDGSLKYVHNFRIVSGNPSVYTQDITIQPCASCSKAGSGDNGWFDYSLSDWQEMFDVVVNIPSSQDYLGRIDDQWTLVPCVLVEETTRSIYGNMIGIYAINPDGQISSEDRIYIGGDVHRCFQNCNKSNRNFFFALKEA